MRKICHITLSISMIYARHYIDFRRRRHDLSLRIISILHHSRIVSVKFVYSFGTLFLAVLVSFLRTIFKWHHFVTIRELQYNNEKSQQLRWLSFCRGSRIRTCDPLLPKQVRIFIYLIEYQNNISFYTRFV